MRIIDCRYKTSIKDIQDKYKFKIFCYDATGTSIADFNANAAQKTQEFNENAVEKTNEFDEHAGSIETDLEQAKEELEYYKTIYNVLPKVEGNGESITLNDTGESILKLNPKGQVKQDTTTGKNTFNKATITDSGKYLMNDGIMASSLDFAISDYIPIQPNTSYVTSGMVSGTGSNPSRCFYDENKTFISGVKHFAAADIVGTSPAGAYYMRESVKVADLDTIQIEQGTSKTDYEPYTYGASPNSNYEQPLHEVSGDNEVVVDSGDALQDITLYDGYISSSDVITSASNWKHSDYIDITDYDYYIVEGNQGTNPKSIIYNANKSPIQVIDINYNSTKTWNLKSYSGAKYLRISTTSSGLASHHLIQRNTYELDLGVENLFTSSIYNDIDVSSSATLQDNGYYEVKFNSNKTIMEGQFKANTQYTISAMAYGSASGNSGVIGFNYTDNTSETKGINQTTPYLYTITSSAGKTIKNIKITYGSQNTTYIKDLQLEEGTKANSYSPYGQTPIKMRGIGTYEDYFVRNSGKNKFNIEQFLIDSEATYTNNHDGSYTTQNYSKLYSQPYVFSDTDIPVSLSGIIDNGTATNIRLQLLNSNNEVVGEITSSSSSLVNKSACKLRINWSTAGTFTLKNIMLNDGSTALGYEPYGTGLWCKYNAIEDIIHNGTENWTAGTAGTNTYVFYLTLSKKPLQSTVTSDFALSTHYIQRWRSAVSSEDVEGMYLGSNYIYYNRIFKTTLTGGTATDYKTWLSNNNDELCYVLETPYLSLIESETLISQLDKVEKALSKEGQTNISQVNNDAPFKIYASALEKISNS